MNAPETITPYFYEEGQADEDFWVPDDIKEDEERWNALTHDLWEEVTDLKYYDPNRPAPEMMMDEGDDPFDPASQNYVEDYDFNDDETTLEEMEEMEFGELADTVPFFDPYERMQYEGVDMTFEPEDIWDSDREDEGEYEDEIQTIYDAADDYEWESPEDLWSE